jgi:hypothetical protein
VSTLGTPRRYYLAKRQAAVELEDDALAAVWRGKQEAEAGTDLPATFPYLTELDALGYTTEEDLDGADACELTDLGLSAFEAEAVLAAFIELP